MAITESKTLNEHIYNFTYFKDIYNVYHQLSKSNYHIIGIHSIPGMCYESPDIREMRINIEYRHGHDFHAYF